MVVLYMNRFAMFLIDRSYKVKHEHFWHFPRRNISLRTRGNLHNFISPILHMFRLYFICSADTPQPTSVSNVSTTKERQSDYLGKKQKQINSKSKSICYLYMGSKISDTISASCNCYMHCSILNINIPTIKQEISKFYCILK